MDLEEKVRQICSDYDARRSSTGAGGTGAGGTGAGGTGVITRESDDSTEAQVPLPDEEFPDWNDQQLFDYFTSAGIFFLPAKGSNPQTMKECFSILVHRKGVLFHRVIRGDRILEAVRVISASRHLEKGEVGICLTHDEFGNPVKFLDPYSTCMEDWLQRHSLDPNLRTQVLSADDP